MNAKFRYTVLACIILVILLELALTLPTPLLYTIEKEAFPSPFHDNAEAMKFQSLNSTTDVDPDLQDFIDSTGPISLNIRIHNIDDARRDLELFQKSHGSLKNLIVKLDMNESEIQDLEQNTALQKDILDSLLNTSETLDSLQQLEIQYHEQNNEDMLSTVRLRGNELRKKVAGLDARYRNATEKIVSTSTKLGLDTTKTQASEKDVEQIVKDIQEPKSTTLIPVDTSILPGEDRVSLFIRPDTGRYRDVIEYMGISLTLTGNTTFRSQGQPITLYIDDQPVPAFQTDTFGYYDAKIPIERITAGSHFVYVRSPTSRSTNRTLTIIPVNSITNLTVSRPDQNATVNCTGFVLANRPVRSASVEIRWDETHVLVTKTDVNGSFMKEIKLPPGRHTIIAGFSGDGYPINASESEPRIVDVALIEGIGPIEPDNWQLLLLIPIIGIVLLFLGAAAFYLQRMTNRRKSLSGTSGNNGISGETGPDILHSGDHQAPGTEIPADGSGEHGDESLIAYYTRLLKEQGLNTTSRKIYEILAVRIARDLRIKRYKTLTAREMSRNCRGKPYCGAFTRFISTYERIRYGGKDSVKDQEMFETAMHSADEQMGGEDH
jgi:hypothetical protein